MGVLQSVSVPAFFVDPNLHYLVVLRMVKLSLRHGNAESSAHAYAAFARVIGPRFGRYQEAYLFGKLGHDLADRSGLLTTKSVVFTLFGQHVVFWTRHYRETYPYTRAGFSAAVESGDLNNGVLQLHLGRAVPAALRRAAGGRAPRGRRAPRLRAQGRLRVRAQRPPRRPRHDPDAAREAGPLLDAGRVRAGSAGLRGAAGGGGIWRPLAASITA